MQHPSLSLLKRICYPQLHSFKAASTTYGCAHEDDALQAYKASMSKPSKHRDFSIQRCGLFVDSDAHYIGASPDALVQCSCCGLGVVEVKCPFCAKDASTLEEVAQRQSNFCLQVDDTDTLKLSKGHPYYLQCQLQIKVTKRAYCDFVVWHPSGLHVERITMDNEYILEAIEKAESFFARCILPELAGKWYTRHHNPLTEVQPPEIHEEDDGRWCVCKESKGGEMVLCEGKNCLIKWFHMSCVGLSEAPSKWFCPTCHSTV